jgi:hypothetical protein
VKNLLLLSFTLFLQSLYSQDSARYLIFRDNHFPASQGYIKEGRKVVVCLKGGEKCKGRIRLDNDSSFRLLTKDDSIINIRFMDVMQIKKVRKAQNAIGLTYLGAGVGVWGATIIFGAVESPSGSGDKASGFGSIVNVMLGSVLNLAALCNTHKKKFSPEISRYKVIVYKYSSRMTSTPSRTQIIMELGE